MLSSVLNSERAIQVNIAIMRAFVKLRELMASNIELAKKIKELERKFGLHHKYIQKIFALLNQLLSEQPPAIGFVINRPEKEES